MSFISFDLELTQIKIKRMKAFLVKPRTAEETIVLTQIFGLEIKVGINQPYTVFD